MNSNVTSSPQKSARMKSVYVYEAPVLIWHWLHTLSIVVLAITGYLIANPLSSVGGEASDYHLMGNMRLIHFIAAYVFAIGFVIRIYWAIVGNRYSREIFFLPVWRADWWRGLWYEVRYYLFIEADHRRIAGHNELAQMTMFFMNTLMTFFMILTGFALYGEGLGSGSWADKLFGWVIPLLGGNEPTHNWHNMGMWIMLTFVIIHVYMAVRGDIFGKQSSISTIIGGWRRFRKN